MNNKFQKGLSLLLLCGVIQLVSHPAFAIEQAAVDVASEDGTGGGGGSSSGGSSDTDTVDSTVVDSDASGLVSIPCLDGNDKVVNASEDEVCKSILPYCADLKKEVEAKVRDALSLKIWGYYKGLNLDLRNSTIDKLEGEKMASPVCSVVGHKMQGGNSPDDEIKNQSIGDKASCGQVPEIVADENNRKISFKYASGSGSRWIAYMQGAYPWLIRRHGYEVLKMIDPNLKNLDKVISNAAMSKDIQTTVAKMKAFQKTLSKEAQASCSKTSKTSNLLTQCKSGALSINDPALRVCKLVTAQLAANSSALPNMIISEIMDGKGRVYEQYDSVFAGLLDFSNETQDSDKAHAALPVMQNLLKTCSDTNGFLRSKLKKMSLTASCIMGEEACIKGKCANDHSLVRISDGRVTRPTFVIHRNNVSWKEGIVGVIEKLIRREICGQNKSSDHSVCDESGIPSKPEGVK